MTHAADQDPYEGFEEFPSDPEQDVADFIAASGKLGELVLDVFDTIDFLGYHEDDAAGPWPQNPASYLAQAEEFMRGLEPHASYVRTATYGEAIALITELARRSFDPFTVARRQKELEESLADFAWRLHAVIKMAATPSS